jgi:hypothetical protein
MFAMDMEEQAGSTTVPSLSLGGTTGTHNYNSINLFDEEEQWETVGGYMPDNGHSKHAVHNLGGLMQSLPPSDASGAILSQSAGSWSSHSEGGEDPPPGSVMTAPNDVTGVATSDEAVGKMPPSDLGNDGAPDFVPGPEAGIEPPETDEACTVEEVSVTRLCAYSLMDDDHTEQPENGAALELVAYTPSLPVTRGDGVRLSPEPQVDLAKGEMVPSGGARSCMAEDNEGGVGAQPSDFELLTVLGQGQFGTVFQVSVIRSRKTVTRAIRDCKRFMLRFLTPLSLFCYRCVRQTRGRSSL